MNKPFLLEKFDHPLSNPRLSWYCPPSKWTIGPAGLAIEPDAKTDFWQKTHYGFEADNGHFLFLEIEGDFLISTRFSFYPAHQYDQAGLMIRISPQGWIKASVEYEPQEPSKLGAVVTRHGFSDWSTQNFSTGFNTLELRIQREGEDYLVEYLDEDPSRTGDPEHRVWTQMRLAHLENPLHLPLKCGLYACSPIEAGFRVEFDFLKIEVRQPENGP